MATYADWNYYTTQYLGNTISQAEWLRLSNRASEFIDQVTYDRASAELDANKIIKIKKATCAVAEELKRIEDDGNISGISSESIAGVSFSYTTNSEKQMSKRERLTQTAKTYLGSTGLMFSGFKDNELGVRST